MVITEKVSDEAGLSPGDTRTLENGEGRDGTFTVTGVAENYVENYVYMTPSVYEDAYGSALEYNSVLGILPDAMGFTIVVEENGHNPNHSYYDIQ